MSYLTGRCEQDFIKWATEVYGYGDQYYLGLPVIIQFLEEFVDFHFPRRIMIGELRERTIVSDQINAIKQANKLYNEEKLYET